MAETNILQRTQPCDDAQHHNHLCYLTERYFHIHEPALFRDMVLNPRFKCEFCGRTAGDACDLCYPVPL
ncbi:MAG: hypothetical protein A2Y76_00620 [Planctomycetes bacterium RBG_13_60_9]|nr:MAG: hypothetical protein A2Y76_00620 [Planctomycetes bacterium RBG_13_60_9]